MSFRTDAVPPQVIDLFDRIKEIVNAIPGTYLAGGTALSLYLGHRVSVDLDFFTPERFLADPLIQQMKALGTFVPLSIRDNSFVCSVNQVQFGLFHYDYPLLESVNIFSEIAIASLRDIAAMKLVAIGQRGARKDFYDLFALLNLTSLKMEEILEDISVKYGISEDAKYHFIRGLAFFEDARKEPEIQAGVRMNVTWEGIEIFFSTLIKTLIP